MLTSTDLDESFLGCLDGAHDVLDGARERWLVGALSLAVLK
jgi:hypothetical protein